MRCKYDNIIAIDPDKGKSGVAFLKPTTRQLEVSNLAFPQLMDYLQFCKKTSLEKQETVIVVVEAGWMVKKSNFHEAQGHRAEKSQRMSGRTMKQGARLSKCASITESTSWNTPRWSSVGKAKTERLPKKNWLHLQV